MEKSNKKILGIIELSTLIISAGLIFMSKTEQISTLPPLMFLIIVSFYFFPFKLLFFDNSKYSMLSTFILALIVGTGALHLYKTFDVLVLILSVINFIFMVFVAFKTNKKALGAVNYKFLILIHFLAFFVLGG